MTLDFNSPAPSIEGASFYQWGAIVKWHKKMTDHLDDPFIQELIYEFGANGYMVYFGVISLICRENKNEITGKATFLGRYLKEKFHISPIKINEILEFCQSKGKLFFDKTSTKPQQNPDKTLTKPKEKSNFSSENFNFNFPKILEIKDNHSYNFKVTSKLLQPKKKKKKKKEKKEEEHTPGECEKSFEFCWNKYPRKAGNKKKALAEFKKAVWPQGDQGVENFLKKMDEYTASVSEVGYLQYGETFFRNWRDIVVSDIAPRKNDNPNQRGEVRI